MSSRQVLNTNGYDFSHVLRLVLLVCLIAFALFGLAASLAVAGLFCAAGPGPETGLIPRFVLKGATFAVLAAAAIYAAWRAAKSMDTSQWAPEGPLPGRRRQWVMVIMPLMLAAALVFPRLDAYPWAAPDETHHLAVARNLATLGVYASGHAEEALRPFDTYDSVGPPVIVPVALAMRAGGVNLAASRVVMALFFLALCVATFALFKPWAGAGAAGLAVLFLVGAYSSVYFARTLYGESPALAFMMAGLLTWRRALESRRGLAWGLGAGAAFGLAVLCKSVLVLAAFAFLGVLLYDRLTFRRIRAAHVIAPAASLVLVVAAWWAVQAFSRHDVADAAGGTLDLYRHYLMFGFTHAPRTAGLALQHPVTTIPLVLAMLVAVPVLFRRRYDPALAVLWLISVFYAWWWVFFTPGVMPRYLWFSAAIASGFAACFTMQCIVSLRATRRAPVAAAVALLLICAYGLPTLVRIGTAARAVFTADEMQDDYAVAEWAARLPRDTKISATWPVSGAINFLANRHADVLDRVAGRPPANQVFIVDTMTRPDLLGGVESERRFGRYAVVCAKE